MYFVAYMLSNIEETGSIKYSVLTDLGPISLQPGTPDSAYTLRT